MAITTLNIRGRTSELRVTNLRGSKMAGTSLDWCPFLNELPVADCAPHLGFKHFGDVDDFSAFDRFLGGEADGDAHFG